MTFLHQVQVSGAGIGADLRRSVAKAEISGALTEVTQLDLTVTDARWTLLGSGLLRPGVRVDVDDFQLEIATISTGDDGGVENLSIACRPVVVRRLKDRRGPRVLRNTSPSQFVVAECQAVGARSIVQSSAPRSQVARDVPKRGEHEVERPASSWTTFQRLARELGFVVFESVGTVYFGKPSWLITAGELPTVAVSYRATVPNAVRTITVPQCRRSLDDPATTVDVDLIAASVAQVRAGKKLTLHGVPTFDGDYIISAFRLDLLAAVPEVSISAATPTDPAPSPS